MGLKPSPSDAWPQKGYPSGGFLRLSRGNLSRTRAGWLHYRKNLHFIANLYDRKRFHLTTIPPSSCNRQFPCGPQITGTCPGALERFGHNIKAVLDRMPGEPGADPLPQDVVKTNRIMRLR